MQLNLEEELKWIGNFKQKDTNNVEKKNLEEELKRIGHFKQKDTNNVV